MVGVGFIGAGNVAHAHKLALLKSPLAKLIAVYDMDENKSRSLVGDIEAKICKSADELVSTRGIDAVYVLTPMGAHYENAVLALRAGKHTFVEKPVSLCREEIKELIKLSKEKSCYCVPGHNYIHAPELRLARELMKTGQLGEACSLWILFNVFLPSEVCRRVAGVLREVMIHHFYSMIFLLGRPDSVFATSADQRGLGPNKEDQALVVCKMPGGGLATLFASFAADDITCDPWTLKYKLIGSRGAASHTWGLTRLSQRSQPLWDFPGYLESFREEDRYFIEDCIFGGKEPLSNMGDALTCLDILAAAEKSIETGTLQKVLLPVA